jgi:hypothetical protein
MVPEVEIKTIGIDLAKITFQVNGIDGFGQCINPVPEVSSAG